MRLFRQKGMTLIELLISISIIAIIVSLAAPSFSSLIVNQKIKGLGNEVTTDLYFSKMESAQSNQCITIEFSVTGYTIKKLAPYINPCSTSTATTITTLKTVVIDGNNTIDPSSGSTYLAVMFDPVRTTATFTGVPINISNTSASSRLLQISVSTLGRPKICSPSGSITGFSPC